MMANVTICDAYLLLPMASMAEAGGPMKVMPASVHFFAKCGFSLNCTMSANDRLRLRSCWPYKSIAWMYALATLLFRNLYYPVSIKICGGIAEVNSKGRAKSMLRTSIWISVEGCRSYTVL